MTTKIINPRGPLTVRLVSLRDYLKVRDVPQEFGDFKGFVLIKSPISPELDPGRPRNVSLKTLSRGRVGADDVSDVACQGQVVVIHRQVIQRFAGER